MYWYYIVLCLFEIYTTLVWEILSAITDVHHQAGLLIAYMKVADAGGCRRRRYHSETKTKEDTEA